MTAQFKNECIVTLVIDAGNTTKATIRTKVKKVGFI
jgi:hypothetical protein